MKKALYGLNSSGAAFREFLAGTLNNIGFRRIIANLDVWMRAATKRIGKKYYEYIMCYVDDILFISHNARQTMGEIQKNMKFGNYKIKDSDFYLGYIFKKKELNIQTMWTMTIQDYVKNTIENLEKNSRRKGLSYPLVLVLQWRWDTNLRLILPQSSTSMALPNFRN